MLRQTKKDNSARNDARKKTKRATKEVGTFFFGCPLCLNEEWTGQKQQQSGKHWINVVREKGNSCCHQLQHMKEEEGIME